MSQKNFCPVLLLQQMSGSVEIPLLTPEQQRAGFQANFSIDRWTGTAARWSWFHGQTRSSGIIRVKVVFPGLSICIALSVTLCYLQNKAAELDPLWDHGPQGRGWKCSVLGEIGFRSCVRVESLPKAVLKAHCGWQGNTSISAWTAERCLVGSLLCWTWTLNHFKFIKHLGICRFSNPKSNPRA